MKMNDINKEKLKEEIKELSNKNSFQLYSFIKNYLQNGNDTE